MRRIVGCIAAAATAVILASCAGSGGSSPVTPPVLGPQGALRGASTQYQVVGYWDGWSQNNLTSTPSGVTEIPIAFGYLRGHSITMPDINPGYVTASDISALHARGIKVSLSLGGWSPSNSFVFDGNVQGFQQSLSSVLAKLPFDGVDFDMEHGTTAARVKALSTLITSTRAYFNSRGMPNAVVSYAAWNKPTDYGDSQILGNSNVVSALSWVNVMSYEHNNVAATESDVAAYGAIAPHAKIMTGVDIDDAPVPSNTSLQQLASWTKSNGYGGMMVWTVNSITAAQLKAIEGQ